jgi:hypothetical protein
LLTTHHVWFSHHPKRLEKQKKYHLLNHLEKGLSKSLESIRIIFHEEK